MTSSWKITTIDPADGIWVADWSRVWEATATKHPLLAPAFARCLVEHFGEPKLHVARYSRNGKCEVMALLHPSGPLSWTIFQPEQAPLPMLIGETDTKALELLEGLLGATKGTPLLLAVPSQDPHFTLLPRDRLEASANTLDYATTISIVAESGFDQYWQSRKKKLRDNIKRYFKKVVESGKKYRLEVLTTPHQMAVGVGEYGNIESAGWKGQAGTAIHADNPQGRFYSQLMESFAEHGNARILHLFFDNTRVASRLAIVSGEMLVFLKTTYDEELKKVAPGRLMLHLALAHFLDEEKLTRIEFYTKANQDMRQWGSEERTTYHVNFYRWPILRQIHKAVTAVKQKALRG